ncbi:DNA damage-repair/toleration protein DRT102 [Ricinus communis]|uniref:DNA-damage-repair/toleration protein DRT102, putative n=1 Tax=Ricinus communis TaxID=3988 RepID=B9RES2_RICCO|nr:DNA damage-repair/toleration protein DRT102 [Ricinus communis]EEF49693.1 DNA-damage-repair/toleration protein DRT102, putative [Ricinus communis]|eukprot:XP_002512241.1 DNA damage-repair/toleration protein DRT102 [Ricinus communis]
MAADSPQPLKIITGADSLGCSLKDALISHLRSLNIDVEDLGTSSYYTIGAEVGRRVSAANSTSPSPEIRGLVACGTGAGVSIFANKFPGVYASTCLSTGDAANTRSINNCNVLAVSGLFTTPESAIQILDTWLSTPFKAPCPASNNAPWSSEISEFLDNSLLEMPEIGQKVDTNIKEEEKETLSTCSLCCLAKNRKLDEIDLIPGGSMKILRESPTSAIVRFKAGSIEPAHHHTFGHDIVVMKGSKSVWNLSKKVKYDLGVGDYLFTPAGDVHRVKYFEDTEFFIKWEGKWDLFFDEDLEVAKTEIEKEADDGFQRVN